MNSWVASKRIAFLNHTAQLGGAEISLLDIVGHEYIKPLASLFILEDGPLAERAERYGIVVKVFPSNIIADVKHNSGLLKQLSLSISGILRFTKLRREFSGYSIIYSNTQKSMILSSILKSKDKVLVWHIRDIIGASYYSKYQRFFVSLIGSLMIDKVIANSESSMRSYMEQPGTFIGHSFRALLGFRRQEIRTVYDAVPKKPSQTINSELLGIETPFCIGIFGRITVLKNQLDAIRAVENMPDVTLLIVGSSDEEPEYMEKILNYIEKNSLQNRVKMLGFKENVESYMQICDIILHTGKGEEALGRNIVEAMLYGIPVIASAGDGPREIIEYGETGLLYNVENIDALRAKIRFLLHSEEYAKEMAKNAQIFAENTFEPFKIGQSIIRFIEGES